MLPLSCKIYRVHCLNCRVALGHIIVDQKTSIEGVINRACATFDTNEIHNNSCEHERNVYKLIPSRQVVKPFVVELI